MLIPNAHQGFGQCKFHGMLFGKPLPGAAFLAGGKAHPNLVFSQGCSCSLPQRTQNGSHTTTKFYPFLHTALIKRGQGLDGISTLLTVGPLACWGL